MELKEIKKNSEIRIFSFIQCRPCFRGSHRKRKNEIRIDVFCSFYGDCFRGSHRKRKNEIRIDVFFSFNADYVFVDLIEKGKMRSE